MNESDIDMITPEEALVLYEQALGELGLAEEDLMKLTEPILGKELWQRPDEIERAVVSLSDMIEGSSLSHAGKRRACLELFGGFGVKAEARHHPNYAEADWSVYDYLVDIALATYNRLPSSKE